MKIKAITVLGTEPLDAGAGEIPKNDDTADEDSASE